MKRIKRKDASAKVVVVVFTHSLIAMFKAAFAEMGGICKYYDLL